MNQMKHVATMAFNLLRIAEFRAAHQNVLLVFVCGGEFKQDQQRRTQEPPINSPLKQYAFHNLSKNVPRASNQILLKNLSDQKNEGIPKTQAGDDLVELLHEEECVRREEMELNEHEKITENHIYHQDEPVGGLA